MTTTRADISRWFDEAATRNAEAVKGRDSYTHMIVVCDEFDWSDFPVFVGVSENVRDVEKSWNDKDLSHVMEIYDLSLDKETQLNEHRTFNR